MTRRAIERSASCQVSDEFWVPVEPLILLHQRDPDKPYEYRPGSGRKRLPAQQVLEEILYVLRTGIRWKALPRNSSVTPNAENRHFQEWAAAGVFAARW